MPTVFHVNLTSFFKFSCRFDEALGTILMVQFLWLSSSVFIRYIFLFYVQFVQFDEAKQSINVPCII